MGENAVSQGGCSCGLIRYAIKDEPLLVQVCHCARCQKMAGTAFVMTAIIEEEKFMCLAGEPEFRQVIKGTSGETYDSSGCASCGSIIFIKNSGIAQELIYFPAGTLDDSNHFTPRAHIFTESKLDWVVIPEDVPQFKKGYENLQELLSQNSLERFNALYNSH